MEGAADATSRTADQAQDGISNFFSSLFGGNDDARACTSATRGGGSVVTVHAASAEEAGRARDIIEENLQVGKRMEQTGGARIRSRIIEKPVEENVRLREEHVNMQRHNVNRPAADADFAAFKEGEMSVTESAERAVVAKEARVVGEVSIDKNVTEREEAERETVRSTDVQVEKLSGGPQNHENDPTKKGPTKR